MRKFMALIKKDYYISKKSLMVPIWITLGFYGMMLLSSLLPLISGKVTWNTMLNFNTNEMDAISPMINYVVNYFAVIGAGVLAVLSSIMISQSALNEDFRRNFELFHRTQPISIWLKSLSKFTVAIIGSWLVLFAVSILNFIIINLFLLIWHQFVPNMAFIAFFQGLVIYMKAVVVIVALGFFASAMFKDKAFFTGLGVLLGIHIFLVMLNTFFNLHIPLPFNLIAKLLFIDTAADITNTTELDALMKIIHTNWKTILFNMQTVYQLLVSTALFVISTYIYKSKEIKI